MDIFSKTFKNRISNYFSHETQGLHYKLNYFYVTRKMKLFLNLFPTGNTASGFGILHRFVTVL